ncbi:hypothetical protein THRCLA_20930 [Thraustotheca clavata]|uniref:Uncharacterized protein n=1 Tax=Thraustotheca clavata TaxID=74557 RepID=A0A1W0A1X2_9STRA|nr:hypothetical protein THRCLA_20930 [Thraustotheca clavata]
MLRGFYAQGLSERPKPTKEHSREINDSIDSSIDTLYDLPHQYKPAFPFDMEHILLALSKGVQTKVTLYLDESMTVKPDLDCPDLQEPSMSMIPPHVYVGTYFTLIENLPFSHLLQRSKMLRGFYVQGLSQKQKSPTQSTKRLHHPTPDFSLVRSSQTECMDSTESVASGPDSSKHLEYNPTYLFNLDSMLMDLAGSVDGSNSPSKFSPTLQAKVRFDEMEPIHRFHGIIV